VFQHDVPFVFMIFLMSVSLVWGRLIKKREDASTLFS
jgi:hypothetical protein